MEEIVTKLQSVGWDAELSSSVTDEENLEALIHEIAHNLVLGDMTPKDMADTARLIRERTPGCEGDADEILATAVTIQTLEVYFGVKGKTQEDSLWAVIMNVKGKGAHLTAPDMVVELLGTDRVNQLSREMFDYIQSVCA